MKRLAAAVCIFILIITFSVYSYITVCRKIDSIIYLLEADRSETAASAQIEPSRTKQIINEWNIHETYLVSMLTHHELEEIEISIKCLEYYMAENLTEEYIKTLNECISRLELVKATEQPDTKNIF